MRCIGYTIIEKLRFLPIVKNNLVHDKQRHGVGLLYKLFCGRQQRHGVGLLK